MKEGHVFGHQQQASATLLRQVKDYMKVSAMADTLMAGMMSGIDPNDSMTEQLALDAALLIVHRINARFSANRGDFIARTAALAEHFMANAPFLTEMLEEQFGTAEQCRIGEEEE